MGGLRPLPAMGATGVARGSQLTFRGRDESRPYGRQCGTGGLPTSGGGFAPFLLLGPRALPEAIP